MKITAQEEYGLRCLLQLATAEDGHSLTIPDIAAAEGLSHPYVAKILNVLRQANLIESARGRAGGYRLAKPPAEIGLGAVMRVLGEPLYEDPAYCQRHAGTETEGNCVHHGACSLRALWLTLEQWMKHTFDQMTLADLLQGEPKMTDMLRAKLAQAVLEPSEPLLTLSVRTTGNNKGKGKPSPRPFELAEEGTR
jgi:Rrf2 family protein